MIVKNASVVIQSDFTPFLGLKLSVKDSVHFSLVANPGVLDILEGLWSSIDAERNPSIASAELNFVHTDSHDAWGLNSFDKLVVDIAKVLADVILHISLEGHCVNTEGRLEVLNNTNGVLWYATEDWAILGC